MKAPLIIASLLLASPALAQNGPNVLENLKTEMTRLQAQMNQCETGIQVVSAQRNSGYDNAAVAITQMNILKRENESLHKQVEELTKKVDNAEHKPKASPDHGGSSAQPSGGEEGGNPRQGR